MLASQASAQRSLSIGEILKSALSKVLDLQRHGRTLGFPIEVESGTWMTYCPFGVLRRFRSFQSYSRLELRRLVLLRRTKVQVGMTLLGTLGTFMGTLSRYLTHVMTCIPLEVLSILSILALEVSNLVPDLLHVHTLKRGSMLLFRVGRHGGLDQRG